MKTWIGDAAGREGEQEAVRTVVEYMPQGAVPGTVRQWHGVVAEEAYLPLPDGPWMQEPTKMQWMDLATGLPCLIVRNAVGNLCGYAGVFRGHPWHGKHYDGEVDVDVHGGLTFASGCAHSTDESKGVCHIPEPGTSDDVWWFGFDCAHLGDLSPGMLAFTRRRGLDKLTNGLPPDTYRDIAYVAREVTSLAGQLKAAA